MVSFFYALVAGRRIAGAKTAKARVAPWPLENYGIGWCTVTSLLPSGNVASTWMSGIISAMPSMTSARDRIYVPSDISCATDLPSRAPSMMAALIRATASG